MITADAIKHMLSDMTVATPVEDGVRVSTHVLYPSNGAVTVTVRGGTDSFIVSDDSGAVSEMLATGIHPPISDRMMRARVRSHGLHVDRGNILSPSVPLNAVPAAILLVANASREVTDWGLTHLQFRQRRDFKMDLYELLSRHFHDNLKHDTPIVGASNKPHKFVHVIYLHGNRKLLIDPVVNEASSINARLAVNLDVRLAKDPHIQQLIVFDDRLKWPSSDLKLLEFGAPTIAFTKAEPEIQRRAS